MAPFLFAKRVFAGFVRMSGSEFGMEVVLLSPKVLLYTAPAVILMH